MKAWQQISNPLQSPVQYKFLLNPGQKDTVKVAGYNTQTTKYSPYTSLNGGVTGASQATSGGSNGGMQICSKTAVPATPTNLRVKSNVWNPEKKYSEIVLEWKGSTNPNAGCVKYYSIQSYVPGGGMKDSKTVDNPAQTTFTHQRILNTGQTAKFEVWAVGYDGKVSGKAVLNSVTGAGAGVTTGR
jgi:hypothetical protein